MLSEALFVFGCLACAPSEESGLCLLAKFGLAYLFANFRRLVADQCPALKFDALPMHTFAAACSAPFNTTGHGYFPPPNEPLATQGGKDRAGALL